MLVSSVETYRFVVVILPKMMCRNLSNLSNVTLTTNDDTRYPVAIAVKNKEASSNVQLATICRSNSVGPPCPRFHPCNKIKKLLLKYSWL
jgi:mRNA-degrading endonuclease toxin of MazEF toxin-antitoxin module